MYTVPREVARSVIIRTGRKGTEVLGTNETIRTLVQGTSRVCHSNRVKVVMGRIMGKESRVDDWRGKLRRRWRWKEWSRLRMDGRMEEMVNVHGC